MNYIYIQLKNMLLDNPNHTAAALESSYKLKLTKPAIPFIYNVMDLATSINLANFMLPKKIFSGFVTIQVYSVGTPVGSSEFIGPNSSILPANQFNYVVLDLPQITNVAPGFPYFVPTVQTIQMHFVKLVFNNASKVAFSFYGYLWDYVEL